LIKKRLEAYLPFLKAILCVADKPQAIDLGCGRGEWLEYLQGLGFDATGVDLDEGMLEACQQLGLSAKKGEMIEFIRTVPDASCMLVSAFHVVEHINFEDLRIFVQEALRVLQSGGLLIMETPNPENIIVATHNFYLDPTHQKPIPPDLLHFVSEHAGFKRSKIVRLQELPELREKSEVSIFDVFSGASPDYSVIAQKLATGEQMTRFDVAFNKDYGLSLNNLLNRWDIRFRGFEHQLSDVKHKAEEDAKAYNAGSKKGALQAQLIEKDNNLRKSEEKTVLLEQELRNSQIQHAITQTQRDGQISLTNAQELKIAAAAIAAEAAEKCQQRLKSSVDILDDELKKTRTELHGVHQANHQHWSFLQERDAHLNAVLHSKSWRVTWPLRKLMQGINGFFSFWIKFFIGLSGLPRKIARWLFSKFIRFVLKRERIKARARHWLIRHPKQEAQIRAFARKHRLVHSFVSSSELPIKTDASELNKDDSDQSSSNVFSGSEDGLFSFSGNFLCNEKRTPLENEILRNWCKK
jgi:O-antigen chain-terminating methyltransferase